MRSISRMSAMGVIAGLGAMGQPAFALQATAPTSAPSALASDGERSGDIVVTAQKRAETLIEVPMSISVLTGDELDKSRFDGVLEALATVPSVSFSSQGAQNGFSQIQLRGVGANSAFTGGAAPIGFYLDSVPFSFVTHAVVPDANVYDLGQVEVLRGPQGTLYGANSLNGVVRVLTKDADVDSFELKARAGLSRTKYGGLNARGDLALNLPIIDGILAARAVVGYDRRSGWVDAPNRKDINTADLSNIRLKLAFRPSDALSMDFSFWRSRSAFGAPDVSTADHKRVSVIPAHAEDLDNGFDNYAVRIGYDLGGASIVSSSAYLKYHSVGGLILPGTTLIFDTDLSLRNWSNETVITSADDQRLRWLAGVYYRDSKESLFQAFAGLDDYSKSVQKAVFGQLNYELIEDRLELTGGLRYFHDTVTTGNYPGQIYPNPPYVKYVTKFNKLTPKATLTYFPSEDLTFYASYGQGFRSGGDQSVVLQKNYPQFGPYGPDTLTNYELGSKGRLIDSLISYDVSLYYINWKNTQQTVGTALPCPNGVGVCGFIPVRTNAGRVQGLGTDVSLTIRPTKGLSLTGTMSWNDLHYAEDILSGGVVRFPKGGRVPSAPKYTFGGSLSYAFPVGSEAEGVFAISGNYVSAQGAYTTNANGGLTLNLGRSYTMMNSSFTINAGKHWGVSAFVDNITNISRSQNVGYANAFPEWENRTRPRTFGVQVEYKY